MPIDLPAASANVNGLTADEFWEGYSATESQIATVEHPDSGFEKSIIRMPVNFPATSASVNGLTSDEFWEGYSAPESKIATVVDPDSGTEKCTRADRLEILISNKCVYFTSRRNLANLINYGFCNAYGEISMLTSGPLQESSFKFESELYRAMLEIQELFSNDKPTSAEASASEAKEEEDAAKRAGQRLERETTNKLLQYLDSLHEENPHTTKVIRDELDEVLSPTRPYNHYEKPRPPTKFPAFKKSNASRFFKTPDCKSKAKNPETGTHDPKTARARIEIIPTKILLSDQYESLKNLWKESKTVMQVFSWNLTTHKKNTYYQYGKKVFNELRKSESFNIDLEILVSKVGKARHLEELRRIYKKNPDLIIAHYNLYCHLEQLIESSISDERLLLQPNEPIPSHKLEFILKELIRMDPFNLKKIPQKYTRILFENEHPMFIGQCKKAKDYYYKHQGKTTAIYPTSKSMLSCIFTFTDDMLTAIFGINYKTFYEIKDASSLVSTNERKQQSVSVPVLALPAAVLATLRRHRI